MAGTMALAVAALTFLVLPLQADPRGAPNRHSKKAKQSAQSEKQGADRWRTLWVGGYRADTGGAEESERWRREKAQTHRDEKARRDREAQERLTREQERRAGIAAKLEREKRAGEERRTLEKARLESKRAKGTPEVARK